jgi:hypothetical protein
MLKSFFQKSLKALGLAFILASSSSAWATTLVGGKHVYILYPGVDAVWGSYIFVVENDSQAAEQYSFPVMLPKETIDFQAQDTLSPQELKLGTDGGITIDKSFPPGETLLQVSFKLPGTQGEALASFTPPYPFQSLGIFVLQDSFSVAGPAGLEIQKGINLSGRNFDTYTLNGGESGKSISYTIGNVPEGRGRLWIIGGIFAGILLITAVTIAYFTRPRLNESEVVV